MFDSYFLVVLISISNGVYASIDYSCLHAKSWLVNTDGHSNEIFHASTGITSSKIDKLKQNWEVSKTGIINYDIKFTESMIDSLNSRPKADEEFINQKTSAVAGQTYAWGADIGYRRASCFTGYWPPGPQCPMIACDDLSFTLTPAPDVSTTTKNHGGCHMTRGPIGYSVSGSSLFGYSDGMTYKNNGQVWFQNAVDFEQFDMDVCKGHAAPEGLYHHHFYSTCLANQLNDTITRDTQRKELKGHSPIYGWILDGYPIYGPYHHNGVLTKSCWKKRNYNSVIHGGCLDNSGKRTCILKDPMNITLGTMPLPKFLYGPHIDEKITTASENKITASSGVFAEDYYYDATCYNNGKNEDALNANNGHSHGNFGFHYHFTVDWDNTPTFPYSAGPTYYGCRDVCCDKIGRCEHSRDNCGVSEGVISSATQCENSTYIVSPEIYASLSCHPLTNSQKFLHTVFLALVGIFGCFFLSGFIFMGYYFCTQKSRSGSSGGAVELLPSAFTHSTATAGTSVGNGSTATYAQVLNTDIHEDDELDEHYANN